MAGKTMEDGTHHSALQGEQVDGRLML